jgi:hypothetical protein
MGIVLAMLEQLVLFVVVLIYTTLFVVLMARHIATSVNYSVRKYFVAHFRTKLWEII